MSESKWNSLPPDVQTVLSEAMTRAPYDYGIEAARIGAGTIEEIEKLGLKMVYLSPQEKARWDDALKGVSAGWVTTVSGQGRPAQQALDFAKSYVKMYKLGIQ